MRSGQGSGGLARTVTFGGPREEAEEEREPPRAGKRRASTTSGLASFAGLPGPPNYLRASAGKPVNSATSVAPPPNPRERGQPLPIPRHRNSTPKRTPPPEPEPAAQSLRTSPRMHSGWRLVPHTPSRRIRRGCHSGRIPSRIALQQKSQGPESARTKAAACARTSRAVSGSHPASGCSDLRPPCDVQRVMRCGGIQDARRAPAPAAGRQTATGTCTG